MCDECDKVSRCSLGVMNNGKKQEEKDSYETNCNNEIQNKLKIRKIVDKMKVKGKLDVVKEEDVVRLFSENCNDLGPYSEGKTEQLKLMSKIRKIVGLMISLSDVRWNVKNNMKMPNKLKCMNKNFTINISDSGEEFEKDIFFLKEGTLTGLWSSIVNYLDIEYMHEQEHG